MNKLNKYNSYNNDTANVERNRHENKRPVQSSQERSCGHSSDVHQRLALFFTEILLISPCVIVACCYLPMQNTSRYYYNTIMILL